MKFRITFKDPNTVNNSINEYAKSLFDNLPLTDEEREDCAYNRAGVISKDVEKWVKYGEYITVEFDLVKKTATVVPQK
jgi:hypothetical protein